MCVVDVGKSRVNVCVLLMWVGMATLRSPKPQAHRKMANSSPGQAQRNEKALLEDAAVDVGSVC